MLRRMPRARGFWFTTALATVPLSCREEAPEDAVRLVKVAEFLHAEASLASWLFDGSSAADGVDPEPHEPVLRAQDLADFVGLERATCSVADVVGDTVQIDFADCPAPFGLGKLEGTITILFGRVSLDAARVIEFMLMESPGDVSIDGHRMSIRYYADAVYTAGDMRITNAFSYRTDTGGAAAGGIDVDFTADPETIVDLNSCALGQCYSPRTGNVIFEAATGCVELSVSEGSARVDGLTGWSINGDYRQCPGKCPGDCGASGYCQLRGGTASLQFEGTNTTHPPQEVELDCAE